MATFDFQHWAFYKTVMDSRQQAGSGPSSLDSFESEEKVRLPPRADGLGRTLRKQSGQNLFNERYLSSEEALSPLGPNMDPPDDECDADDILDDYARVSGRDSKRASKNPNGDLAVAVTIVVVGKAKVVDVPSSPATETTHESREISPSGRTEGKTTPVISAVSSTPPARASTPPSTSSSAITALSCFSDPTLEEFIRPLSTPLANLQFGSVANRKSQHNDGSSPPFLQDLQLSPQSQPRSHADPLASSSRSSSSLSESQQRPSSSRLKNISHKFSLHARKSSAAPKFDDAASPTSEPREPKCPSSYSPASPTFATARQSRPMTKMQARGAAEREPTFELPSYPQGESDKLSLAQILDESRLPPASLGRAGAMPMDQKQVERPRRSKSLLGRGRR